eukprot:403366040
MESRKKSNLKKKSQRDQSAKRSRQQSQEQDDEEDNMYLSYQHSSSQAYSQFQQRYGQTQKHQFVGKREHQMRQNHHQQVASNKQQSSFNQRYSKSPMGKMPNNKHQQQMFDQEMQDNFESQEDSWKKFGHSIHQMYGNSDMFFKPQKVVFKNTNNYGVGSTRESQAAKNSMNFSQCNQFPMQQQKKQVRFQQQKSTCKGCGLMQVVRQNSDEDGSEDQDCIIDQDNSGQLPHFQQSTKFQGRNQFAMNGNSQMQVKKKYFNSASHTKGQDSQNCGINFNENFLSNKSGNQTQRVDFGKFGSQVQQQNVKYSNQQQQKHDEVCLNQFALMHVITKTYKILKSRCVAFQVGHHRLQPKYSCRLIKGKKSKIRGLLSQLKTQMNPEILSMFSSSFKNHWNLEQEKLEDSDDSDYFEDDDEILSGSNASEEEGQDSEDQHEQDPDICAKPRKLHPTNMKTSASQHDEEKMRD